MHTLTYIYIYAYTCYTYYTYAHLHIGGKGSVLSKGAFGFYLYIHEKLIRSNVVLLKSSHNSSHFVHILHNFTRFCRI